MNKQEFHQHITNKMLKAMYSAGKNWMQAWAGVSPTMPMNATTKAYYHGYNILTLWTAQQDMQYPTSEWATYRQWAAAGHQVKKGESAKLNHQVIIKVGDTIKEGENGEADQHFKWQKMFHVFNAAQVEGYEPTKPIDTGVRSPEWFDQILTNLNVEIDVGAPSYIPHQDRLFLPQPQQFKSTEHYIGTSTHELIHWTGHKTRLDRTFGAGRKEYAEEELVAEMGRAFTLAHWGLGDETLEHSAKYLNGWIKYLENDPRAVQRMASAAGAASEYLIEHAHKPRIKEVA